MTSTHGSSGRPRRGLGALSAAGARALGVLGGVSGVSGGGGGGGVGGVGGGGGVSGVGSVGSVGSVGAGRRALLTVAFLSLGSLGAPLIAHGGDFITPQYTPPTDAGAGNASAPPSPGPGAVGGRSGPAVGGAVTSTTRSRGTDRAGARGRRPGDAAQRAAFAPSYDTWEFWWEHNKDAFLDLRLRLGPRAVASGGSAHFTGRGRKAAAMNSRRATLEQVQQVVVPALAALIEDGRDADIVDSSLLAIARLTTATDDPALIGRVREQLGSEILSVQWSAALALGLLGSSDDRALLVDLMADASRGRAAVGGGAVHWQVRANAALALGFLGDREATASLIDVIRRTPDTDRDLKACAILALGLLGRGGDGGGGGEMGGELGAGGESAAERGGVGGGGDLGRSSDVVDLLAELMLDRRLDPPIQSYVPLTLGRLGAHEALDVLLASFTDPDTDVAVRQSVAIALGRLGRLADAAVLDALHDYVAEGRDAATRHFALISLGKIGARDAERDADDGVAGAEDDLRERAAAAPASDRIAAASEEARATAHARLVRTFVDETLRPNHRASRSWAAIAAALYARAHPGRAPRLVDAVGAAYDDEKDPSFKAGFAIALGLMNAREVAPALVADFEESRDPAFRGYAAVALGLMNDVAAADTMRELCRRKGLPPTFRQQVATALGLMGDRSAVSVLIETMQDGGTLSLGGSAAQALGLIGDRDAVEPLVALACDERAADLARAWACVALGIVGEKTALPWNTPIRADCNYLMLFPAVQEVLAIY